ncbi:MAG: hypothetical protein CL663_08380 [Bacteroidetes bacterium]|nr:hypothetical protein [Bacteroidota bacterium]|tara:strand:- start:295 stop:567 length:273 start_codon:yes stop_codon:yes gene_type:complete
MKLLNYILLYFSGFYKKDDDSSKMLSYYSLGRNSKCYCDSGKKYKQCHLVGDEKKNKVAIFEVDQNGNKKVKLFKKGKVSVNVQGVFAEA